MPFYRSPGVYIVEKPIVPGTVAPVGTGSLAIWGKFPWGPTTPTLVTSWKQFVEEYGEWGGIDNAKALNSLFGAGVSNSTKLPAYAVYQYFLNGGASAYVVNAVTGGAKASNSSVYIDSSATPTKNKLTVTAKYPGTYGNKIRFDVAMASSGTPKRFKITVKIEWSASNVEVVEVFDEVSIDNPSATNYISKLSSKLVTFSLSDFDASVIPDSGFSRENNALTGGADPSEDTNISTIVSRFSDLNEILIFVSPQNENNSSALGNIKNAISSIPYSLLVLSFDMNDPTNFATSLDAYGALRSDKVVFYYPYIWMVNPATDVEEEVSPSGAIAGVYIRNDIQYNVGKTPAGVNAVVNGATALSVANSKTFIVPQSVIDTLYPKHFNPIIYKDGIGVILWGARLSTLSDEWRYINKRRLLYFVEKSIKDAIAWVNFENNTPDTRFKVQMQIDSFLRRLTLEGYFASRTPSEAYFVICDSTNNPPDLVNSGYLVVDVGIAPGKPAEFIVLRFTEKVGG
jgi:hypothetical protein